MGKMSNRWPFFELVLVKDSEYREWEREKGGGGEEGERRKEGGERREKIGECNNMKQDCIPPVKPFQECSLLKLAIESQPTKKIKTYHSNYTLPTITQKFEM